MVLPASIYISLVQGRPRISRRVSFSAPAKKLAPLRAFLDVTSQLQSENLVKAINMFEANRAGNSNGRTTRGFVPGVCTNLNINIDTVYYALKKRKMSASSSSEFLQPLVDSRTTLSNNVSKERNKGGRL